MSATSLDTIMSSLEESKKLSEVKKKKSKVLFVDVATF